SPRRRTERRRQGFAVRDLGGVEALLPPSRRTIHNLVTAAGGRSQAAHERPSGHAHGAVDVRTRRHDQTEDRLLRHCRPAPRGTTPTIQQKYGLNLRISPRQSMRTAQSLYEHGYITYMRTDSSALSDQAIAAARKQVTELYGPEFVPQSPRQYASKQKSAQEAH